jgi:FkbM family methyltransferase
MCMSATPVTAPAADVGAPSALPASSSVARRLRFIREYGLWRRAVRELWRFKWREHRARPIVGAYHTRSGGVPYFIRHSSRDVGIFSEIFIAGEYDPPQAVLERLGALDRPPRILDLGANIGLFAASCSERWPGASITTVEPDPENLELLRRTAAAGSIEVVPACATNYEGSVRFVAGEFAESHVAGAESSEQDTIEVPCVDAFRLAQSADLVKIDIEGSEWEILADPRLASLPAQALVMEWHDKQCSHPDPRAAAHAALTDAGFEVLCEHRPVASNGTIWALRPS